MSELRSPYQGLRPFSEAEAAFFFGRDSEKRLVVANLYASTLTLVYGDSGVGKTSLLRAGVMKRLGERSGILGIYFHQWRGDALGGLKAEIAQVSESMAPRADDDEPFEPLDISLDLSSVVRQAAEATGRRPVLLLDQFEEYFSEFRPGSALDLELADAINSATDTGAAYLLSLREDFLASLDRFEGTIPGLFDNYLRVESLGVSGAREAIEGPVDEWNELELQPTVILEPALVDAVVPEDASNLKIAYLQLVMERLWADAHGGGGVTTLMLRAGAVREAGGMEQIVRDYLASEFGNLDVSRQDAAALMFGHLVTPSGAKVPFTVGDLSALTGVGEEVVRGICSQLSGDVRILRIVPGASSAPDELRYEIDHDALSPAILDWVSERKGLEAEAARRSARRWRRWAVALAVVTSLGIGTVLILQRQLLATVVAVRIPNHENLNTEWLYDGDKEIATPIKLAAEERQIKIEVDFKGVVDLIDVQVVTPDEGPDPKAVYIASTRIAVAVDGRSVVGRGAYGRTNTVTLIVEAQDIDTFVEIAELRFLRKKQESE